MTQFVLYADMEIVIYSGSVVGCVGLWEAGFYLTNDSLYTPPICVQRRDCTATPLC